MAERFNELIPTLLCQLYTEKSHDALYMSFPNIELAILSKSYQMSVATTA